MIDPLQQSRFGTAQPVRSEEWAPWMRLLAMLQPHRDWRSFCNTLGNQLELLTGAPAIALCFRDAHSNFYSESLLGPCPPLPSSLPETLGEVTVEGRASSALIYQAMDLSAWLVFFDPGRWNLEHVLRVVGGQIGQVAARVWRFWRLRQKIGQALESGLEVGSARYADEVAAVLGAVADAADGTPVFIGLPDDAAAANIAWWIGEEAVRNVPLADPQLAERFAEAGREGRGLFLHGEPATALASIVSPHADLNWFYFLPLTAAPRLKGLMGLGLALSSPVSTNLQMEEGLDHPSPVRSGRLMQVRAVEQLKVVIGEIKQFLASIGRRQQAYVQGVVQERTLLGIELHDSVLQDLTYLQLQLGRLEQAMSRDPSAASEILGQARSVLSTSSKETRELSVGLVSSEISEDLPAVIDGLLVRFRTRFEGDVELTVGGSRRPVAPALNSQIMRICQELLNNVVKHAAASRVDVDVLFEADAVVLVVSDNGRGFVLDQRAPDRVGLYGLQKRAEQLNATMDIKSEVGTGTTVTVRVPL